MNDFESKKLAADMFFGFAIGQVVTSRIAKERNIGDGDKLYITQRQVRQMEMGFEIQYLCRRFTADGEIEDLEWWEEHELEVCPFSKDAEKENKEKLNKKV